MGCKPTKLTKQNKDHVRQRMFRFGGQLGRGDLSLEANMQMGYMSKHVKRYSSCDLTDDKPAAGSLVTVTSLDDGPGAVADVAEPEHTDGSAEGLRAGTQAS